MNKCGRDPWRKSQSTTSSEQVAIRILGPHGAWVSLLGDSARQDMHDSNAALHPPEVRLTRALSRVGMSGNMRFLTARTGMTATRTRGHRLRAIGCGPSVAGQTIVRRSAPSSFFLPDSSQGQSLRPSRARVATSECNCSTL